ncbi:hypothetical protein FRB99_004231 [Tulasnella sp. 403]|nr:hypothetical protein FRB99_004231 [Tulasnella sp. 403]
MTPSARRGPNNDHQQLQSLNRPHQPIQPLPQPPFHHPVQPQLQAPNNVDGEASEIFVDPAMGTPLPIYVERDVANHDVIVSLIKRHGGVMSSNYSTVQYLLVDRQRETGQSLYRQYHNKRGKIVLDAQWVIACVQAGEMLTFKKNWGGFKVTGNELVINEPGVQPVQPVQPSVPLGPPTTIAPPPPPAGPQPRQSSRQKAKQRSLNGTVTEAEQPPAAPTETRPQPSSQAAPPPPAQGHFSFGPPVPGMHLNGPSNFGTWGHVAPPNTVVSRPAVHHHTHPSQQQQAQQTPTPSNLAQQHAQPSQSQPQQPPPQQVTHLSQVHHRPPSQHLLHPFAAPSAPAAALAMARGHWYGVAPGPPASLNPVPPVETSETPRAGQQTTPNPQNFAPQLDPAWAQHHEGVYYPPTFASFPPEQYVVGASGELAPETSEAQEPPDEEENEDDARGRKRKRVAESAGSSKRSKYIPPPPTNPSSLVPALAPPRRSPTPPSRIVKSTYGGNLFTTEDIEYLKKYIDWCVDMGLVLSLREICERLAIKAPHHTFYSWRRYCNKHKIKLGSYQMKPPDAPNGNTGSNDAAMREDEEEGLEVEGDQEDEGEEPEAAPQGPLAGIGINLNSAGGAPAAANKPSGPRRSPTPPRSLHRSTTGKGIAFTDEDVTFLVKYLTYRKQKEPNLNFPQFWNDLAVKAPHHSRASWLKYWRRHKHEIEVQPDGEAAGSSGGTSAGWSATILQVPSHNTPVGKRQRYSHEDDILLAKFWASEPQGTSDKLFQDFARMSGFVDYDLARCSIHIILGRDGKSIIGYTRLRSII